MDSLSEIVALLQPRDCVAAGFDAAGDWSIQFERHVGLKCNSVIKGGCWIAVDGGAPIWLDAGDCAILPHGSPFILSAHPVSRGADAKEIYAPVAHGGTASYGGGGKFFMAGSRFLLTGPAAEMLLPSLPPILGTIASSGHVHKCPEKSRKSGIFVGHTVHPHPPKFIAIDGI